MEITAKEFYKSYEFTGKEPNDEKLVVIPPSDIIELMEKYHQFKLKSMESLSSASEKEERVAVVCSTCKWSHAKYEYKCEGCTLTYKNWEQDTDR